VKSYYNLDSGYYILHEIEIYAEKQAEPGLKTTD
jgi:hypothetical protein